MATTDMNEQKQGDRALEAVCAAALTHASELEHRSHSDSVIAEGDRIRAAVSELRGVRPMGGWSFGEYEREKATLKLAAEHGAAPDDDGEKRGRWALLTCLSGSGGDEALLTTWDTFGELAAHVADELLAGREPLVDTAFDLDAEIGEKGRPGVAFDITVTAAPRYTI